MAEHTQQYEPQFGAQPPPPAVPQHREDPPPLMPPYNSTGQMYRPLATHPYHVSSRTSQADGMEMAIEPQEPLPPPLMGPPPGLLAHPIQQHGPPKRDERLDQQAPPPPNPEEYLRPPNQGPPSLVHVPQHEFYMERSAAEGPPPLQELYTSRDPPRGPSGDRFNQPPLIPHDRPDAPYFPPPTAPLPPQDPFYVPPAYPVGPPMGTEVPTIPEVKKKALPAWLREGLEKVARDKQKQQELEERKKMEMQEKEGSRWSDDDDEAEGNMEEEKSQEHAPFGQSNSPLSGPLKPRGILKKAPPNIVQVVTAQVGERQEGEEEEAKEEKEEEEEEEEEEEGEEGEEDSDREVAEKLSDEEMVGCMTGDPLIQLACAHAVMMDERERRANMHHAGQVSLCLSVWCFLWTGM